MTMREKMARAMWLRSGQMLGVPVDVTRKFESGEVDQKYYFALVDTALDALMKPMAIMLTEGGVAGEWSGRVQGCENEEAMKVWQAMIIAAKEGK